MIRPDLINGVFEATGSVAVWANVRRLYRDKIIKGVCWQPMVFFSSWGVWNLYYYPHLGQWLSFLGGISIALANIVWTAMAVYYLRRKS